MKLSEAIRLGSMATERGQGPSSIVCREAPCALGAALLAIGKMPRPEFIDEAYDAVDKAWPEYVGILTHQPCPACAKNRFKRVDSVLDNVWHLNDVHEWSREQIADWVETIEQAQEANERRAIAEGQPVEPAQATAAA